VFGRLALEGAIRDGIEQNYLAGEDGKGWPTLVRRRLDGNKRGRSGEGKS